MADTRNDWEKEFDELFCAAKDNGIIEEGDIVMYQPKGIKQFIRELLIKERKR